VSVSGEDFLQELDLTDDDFSKWDRDLEEALFKLESNRPLDAYLKEDTVRLLSDFGDLLARLEDLRFVEIVADDDEEDEEEEAAKVATSPDAAAVGTDKEKETIS
jgi:hypothetical protein